MYYPIDYLLTAWVQAGNFQINQQVLEIFIVLQANVIPQRLVHTLPCLIAQGVRVITLIEQK